MQPTNQPDPTIIAEFSKRRTRQLILIAPLIAAMIPVLMLENAGPDGLWGVPASVIAPGCIAVIIAGVIYSLFNWRCPACNKYLGKGISPRFCRHCGAQLQS